MMTCANISLVLIITTDASKVNQTLTQSKSFQKFLQYKYFSLEHNFIRILLQRSRSLIAKYTDFSLVNYVVYQFVFIFHQAKVNTFVCPPKTNFRDSNNNLAFTIYFQYVKVGFKIERRHIEFNFELCRLPQYILR